MKSIKGLVIMDNDGARILSKYYDNHFASLKDKIEFEQALFKKTYNTGKSYLKYLITHNWFLFNRVCVCVY